LTYIGDNGIMSNMKDYAMWLDDRGIAVWDNNIGELVIPSGINVYTPALVSKYKNDKKWQGVELDDDDCIIEEEEELIIDDGDLDDCAWTPDDVWFNPDGGLTGEAYDFLATTDSQGDFI